MHVRALMVLASCVVVAGCPSKEGERRDANAGGSTTPPPSAAPAGPLAGLESSPFMNEVWNAEGNRFQVLYYARENVRVSAQCRTADGQLACDALRQLRGGPPVEIPKRELDGRTSAGVKACTRLQHPLVTAMSTTGNEETFCRFPDGSLLSTGTLEQYGVKVGQ